MPRAGRSGVTKPLRGGTPVVVDDLFASPAAEPAPARPEDHREDGADDADDQQNPADRHELETTDAHVDRPDQDRAGRDQEETRSDSHVCRVPAPRAPKPAHSLTTLL